MFTYKDINMLQFIQMVHPNKYHINQLIPKENKLKADLVNAKQWIKRNKLTVHSKENMMYVN